VFPNNAPYLDQDTVFGVCEDLVTAYLPQKAGAFLEKGFELLDKVEGEYFRIDFAPILLAK